MDSIMGYIMECIMGSITEPIISFRMEVTMLCRMVL